MKMGRISPTRLEKSLPYLAFKFSICIDSTLLLREPLYLTIADRLAYGAKAKSLMQIKSQASNSFVLGLPSGRIQRRRANDVDRS